LRQVGHDTGDSTEATSEAREEEKLSPEDRKYLGTAKPFAVAIAGRKYEDAYAQLSSHAKARVSLNQFVPEDDGAKFAQNEKNPVANIAVEKFRELMKRT
jgi:hypothetical protein